MEALWNAVESDDIFACSRFIAFGADINYSNPEQGGRTALHEAIRTENLLIAEYLLLWISNLDVADENGWTALHFAASIDSAKYPELNGGSSFRFSKKMRLGI